MSFYTGTNIQICLDTKEDLSGSSERKILYRKPNGVKGEWTANVSGQSLVYYATAADMDLHGQWQLQASYKIGGESFKGEIAIMELQKAVN